jgi:anaerobic magnesium-protoporphyrin IX monomethyl ester cyclase
MNNSKGKVIFINPVVGPAAYLDDEDGTVVSEHMVYPYPGLMILASVLDKAGYNAVLLDANLYTKNKFQQRLFHEIDDDVIFVGFSLMTMNVVWAYPVIEEIKTRYPKIKIAAGGFHPTLFPDQMIEDEYIDIVALNESASIIEPLTEALKTNGDLSTINGIYYKKGGVVCKNPPNTELDGFKEVPFINLSQIEHEKYSRNNAVIYPYFPKNSKDYITYPILTSFGCPYKCTFCINAILERRYRYRSAESIVDRIEYLINTHNANFIILQDEEFCINKKRFLRFVELVEERKLKFQWRTSLRVSNFRDDYIDDALAQRLQNIGMVSAVMGGESGNQRMLDEIKKEITVEEIIHALEILSRTTIIPKISFMTGMPGETDSEIQETYSLCVKLKKMFSSKNKIADIGIFPFRLYPGSPLYDKAVEDLGLEADDRSFKEIASVRGSKMSEGMGYEPTYLKYVSDPKQFEDMLFLYDKFVWLNPKRTNIIRNWLEMTTTFRIERGWYKFAFIEKSLFKFAKGTRDLWRKMRAKLKPSNSSSAQKPKIKNKLQKEAFGSDKETEEAMHRESSKRTYGGC